MYKQDKGVFPDTLQALTPDYLPEIPADPFTNKQTLTYKINPVSQSRWQELRQKDKAKDGTTAYSELQEGKKLWRPFELYYWGINDADDSDSAFAAPQSAIEKDDALYW